MSEYQGATSANDDLERVSSELEELKRAFDELKLTNAANRDSSNTLLTEVMELRRRLELVREYAESNRRHASMEALRGDIAWTLSRIASGECKSLRPADTGKETVIRPLVFLDLETTGLDPEIHEVWEAAWAVDDGPIETVQLPHSLANADPITLAINQYWDRVGQPNPNCDILLRDVLQDVTIVGANPAFDAAFLRTSWKSAPWRYRLLDVQAYAMPLLGHDRPCGLSTIADELRTRGFDIPTPDHTAGRDVETLRECFRALRDRSRAITNAPRE